MNSYPNFTHSVLTSTLRRAGLKTSDYLTTSIHRNICSDLLMSVHHDPPHAPEFESYRDELFSRMSHVEKSWRDRQAFLEASGYMLRPRYRPGWVPSWRGKGGAILPTFCEDAIALPVSELTCEMELCSSNIVFSFGTI